mmetsp:Transcript_56949/g.165034  ORF Transcript_56949/g.165034 Transcript_56949/m.165034 type:complete len:127 (-) Transcript_56949:367-747(-)
MPTFVPGETLPGNESELRPTRQPAVSSAVYSMGWIPRSDMPTFVPGDLQPGNRADARPTDRPAQSTTSYYTGSIPRAGTPTFVSGEAQPGNADATDRKRLDKRSHARGHAWQRAPRPSHRLRGSLP